MSGVVSRFLKQDRRAGSAYGAGGGIARRPWTSLLLVLASGMNASCGDVRPRMEVHPTPEYILRPGGVDSGGVDSLSVAAPESKPQEFQLGSPFASTFVGRFDGPSDQVLGRIADLAEDSLGQVIVLDQFPGLVRVFAPSGAALHVSRASKGIADFSDAQVVWLGPRDRIYVGESNGRITLLSTISGDVEGSFTFSGQFWDACFVGERLFVHGITRAYPGVIHELTPTGEYVRGFAAVYGSRSRLINTQISQGSMACLETARVVLLAPHAVPEIRAYNLDGQAAWWVKIDGFRPMTVLEVEGGSIMKIPDSHWHAAVAVVAAKDGASALYQIAHYTGISEGRNRILGLDSYALSVVDRSVSLVSRSLPRMLTWGGRYDLATVPDPYPQLIRIDVKEYVRSERGSD